MEIALQSHRIALQALIHQAAHHHLAHHHLAQAVVAELRAEINLIF